MLNREMVKLYDIIYQINLTNIYISFHPNTKELICFLESHGTFFKINHRLGHEARLNRYKKVKSHPLSYLTEHVLKLNINNRKNRKSTKSWKMNDFLLNKQCVQTEYSEGFMTE